MLNPYRMNSLLIFFPIYLNASVKTELMEDGANSTLSIAKIHKADSGNYTCSISEYQNFTIVVHILNGKVNLSIKYTILLITYRSVR